MHAVEILLTPDSAGAVLGFLRSPTATVDDRRRWLNRTVCMAPEDAGLWEAWIRSALPVQDARAALLVGYVRMIVAPTVHHLDAFVSILEGEGIERPSAVLSEHLPDRLRRSRGAPVRLASLLTPALAVPAVAARALTLLTCDGQTRAQAVDTAVLLVCRMPVAGRVRTVAGLAANLRAMWNWTASERPTIIVAEPGAGSEDLARLVAARLARPFRHLDIPDIFKTSAALSIFRESSGDAVLFYSESPPTPALQVILQAFSARFVLLCRSSRPLGEAPRTGIPVDITDSEGSRWGAPGDDVALLTWEAPLTHWRHSWRRILTDWAGADGEVLDVEHWTQDDAVERVARSLSGSPGPLGDARETRFEFKHASAETEAVGATVLTRACLALRERMEDPPSGVATDPDRPLQRRPGRLRQRSGRSTADCVDGAVTEVRDLEQTPFSNFLQSLRIGLPGNPAQQTLLREILPARRPAPKIFICGPPKSQAVYFARAAAYLYGWRMENLARESVYGVDGYATVQLDYLLEHYDEPLIIWSHSPATNLQLNLLRFLDIDAHISIGNVWDDLVREVSTWGTDDEIKTSPIPGSDLPLDSQVWQLVLQGFSSYVRFYAGWSMALAGGGARGSLAPIDQALDNEIAYLRRIVGSHASGSDAELRRCLDKAAANAATTRHQTNPRLGPPLRSGIGYDVFPPDVRSAAQALYRRFPSIDFKMIDPRLCDVS